MCQVTLERFFETFKHHSRKLVLVKGFGSKLFSNIGHLKLTGREGVLSRVLQ